MLISVLIRPKASYTVEKKLLLGGIEMKTYFQAFLHFLGIFLGIFMFTFALYFISTYLF